MKTPNDLRNCIARLETRIQENRSTMRILDLSSWDEDDAEWIRSVLETSIAQKQRLLTGINDIDV